MLKSISSLVREKRYILEISALVVAIVLIAAVGVHALQKSIYLTSVEPKDLKRHKDSFVTIADMLYEQLVPSIEDNENIDHIIIHELSDKIELRYYNAKGDVLNTEYQSIDESIKKCFLQIHSALSPDSEGRGSFYDIYVCARQVAFRRCGNRYALIYAPHSRPSYITNEREDCFIDRTGADWYHAVNKNGYNAMPV